MACCISYICCRRGEGGDGCVCVEGLVADGGAKLVDARKKEGRVDVWW